MGWNEVRVGVSLLFISGTIGLQTRERSQKRGEGGLVGHFVSKMTNARSFYASLALFQLQCAPKHCCTINTFLSPISRTS